MRRAARADTNQPDIVRKLRSLGASIWHTHTIGRGAKTEQPLPSDTEPDNNNNNVSNIDVTCNNNVSNVSVDCITKPNLTKPNLTKPNVAAAENRKAPKTPRLFLFWAGNLMNYAFLVRCICRVFIRERGKDEVLSYSRAFL